VRTTLRAARLPAVLAALAAPLACQTVSDPLPPQATLNVDVTDSQVASQRAPLPAPQIVAWRIEDLTAANVAGLAGVYSFMYSGPCSYQLNNAAPVLFSTACRTSGLTLQPGIGITAATIRLTLSRLEVRVAARPDLSSGADPDGDGIPNESDNCPIIANPLQENVNAASESPPVGDACSDPDSTGSPTVADQDKDGVPDQFDNCLWYPNPATSGLVPTDSNADGIGDACERVAPVVLPKGSLTIECDNISFVTRGSAISFFRFDFGQPGVLSCDAGFTGCSLDPSAIRLSLVGTSTTFPCHAAP
jgi:hypothetical protein